MREILSSQCFKVKENADPFTCRKELGFQALWSHHKSTAQVCIISHSNVCIYVHTHAHMYVGCVCIYLLFYPNAAPHSHYRHAGRQATLFEHQPSYTLGKGQRVSSEPVCIGKVAAANLPVPENGSTLLFLLAY